MATKYWIGGATAIAQVHTGSIDSVDGTPANNDFTVTIGGVEITQAGDTDVATTAAALVALLNASTHPYFSGITWTNPSSGNIVGTAGTAGVPFVAALTETGAGTGSVTDFAETTANEGSVDFNTAANWSDNTVPANSDTIVFANTGANLFYGLDQSSLSSIVCVVEQTYTGLIGLPHNEFATSEDGLTSSTTVVPEYRQSYLKAALSTVDIGQHFGPGTPNGSGRIKIENSTSGASATTVHNTKQAGNETGVPAVQLLFAHASADVFIRSAAGGVGIASLIPGETATVGDISVADGNVYIGEGVTWTNLYVSGGSVVANAANSPTLAEAKGGTLTIEGDFTLTQLDVNGGTIIDNHIKTSGNANTTVNLNSGALDATQNTEPKTWAAININGGTLLYDEHLTMTAVNEPNGPVSIQIDSI